MEFISKLRERGKMVMNKIMNIFSANIFDWFWEKSNCYKIVKYDYLDGSSLQAAWLASSGTVDYRCDDSDCANSFLHLCKCHICTRHANKWSHHGDIKLLLLSQLVLMKVSHELIPLSFTFSHFLLGWCLRSTGGPSGSSYAPGDGEGAAHNCQI